MAKGKANVSRDIIQGAIGWYSNSPYAATGYGQQTTQVLRRLRGDLLKVAAYSNYGLEGHNGTINLGTGEIDHYARGFDTYSNDVVPAHHAKFTHENKDLPNLLITLYDVWVLNGPRWADHKIASWVPIDHSPVPPAVGAWLAQDNVAPIAMSKFGQQVLAMQGIESTYIPHAFEKTFRPMTELDGVSVRKYFNLGEDRFIFLMNAANKAAGLVHRKAFAEAFMAFGMFAKHHPEALLYVHSDALGSAGGWNLTELAAACSISPEQIVFADPYHYRNGLDQDELAALYSAADVLLATSYGEGFGCPTVEAQLCGTPVIASNFAASRELAGPDSYLVDGQPLWDPAQKAWFTIPSIPGILESMDRAFARGRQDFPKTVEWAQQYDADHVYKTLWRPFLRKHLK